MSPTVLAHYNPNRPTTISVDASNTGLGAVLFQVQDDGQRRPVCYASRSLSDTEKRYAVIEKEALATTWASERFSDNVLGIHFTLETDHKPPTVLLNSSEHSKMPRPPCILRFRLRLMWASERFSDYVFPFRGTQREYSSKPLKHIIVKRILVFKR